MEHRLLAYKNSLVSYYFFGTGPRQVVCFHGYGEDATLYAFLEKYAGNQFTFYSIDLPFHGQTAWNEGLNFSHNDLHQIIGKIQLESNYKSKTGNQKLILLGFSLGGRIALSFYQAEPQSVEKIILLAPDGLVVNPWYWFATQTWIGNSVFIFSMKYPGWFFAFLKLLNKLGLVNASVFKFVNYYIGKPEARTLLYQRWTGLRKLKPNLPQIKNLIKQYKTPTRLVYGKYDRIILPVRGEKFNKGIEEFCTLTIINSGHQVVHENHVEGIVNALLH
ncbi:MAG: alpha/beta fold hydrolase [Chitinophagaceae bacterium]